MYMNKPVTRKYAWDLLKLHFIKCIENNQDAELPTIVKQMEEWELEHESTETNQKT